LGHLIEPAQFGIYIFGERCKRSGDPVFGINANHQITPDVLANEETSARNSARASSLPPYVSHLYSIVTVSAPFASIND
jgi:hypothetical protein